MSPSVGLSPVHPYLSSPGVVSPVLSKCEENYVRILMSASWERKEAARNVSNLHHFQKGLEGPESLTSGQEINGDIECVDLLLPELVLALGNS